jgi:hypothetical protein
MIDTVYFPALIKSGSTFSSFGKGPNPKIPFSDYKVISTPGSK